MSEEVYTKLPAGNTTIKLLTVYTYAERRNAQRYRRTDRQRRTDGVMMPIADHTAIGDYRANGLNATVIRK